MISLQWGRGFSAAETRARRGTRASAATRLQWGRGFSAAETIEAHRVEIRDRPASMGPRLFSRGNLQARANLVFSKLQLQWGRGFSAAETGERQLRRRTEWPDASMGPRLFSRGNHPLCWAYSLTQCIASMGPRLFSRGNGGRGRSPFASHRASMGPRLFSRGNEPHFTHRGFDHRPGFNGAAAFQPRKHVLGGVVI